MSDSNLTNPTPVCFFKELTANKISVSGTVVLWEDLGGDSGCLVTNDVRLIGGLREFIDRRVGGVSEIPCAEFEAKKKRLRDRGQVIESLREKLMTGLRPKLHVAVDGNPNSGQVPSLPAVPVVTKPVVEVPAGDPVQPVVPAPKLPPEPKPSEASRPVAKTIVPEKTADPDLF